MVLETLRASLKTALLTLAEVVAVAGLVRIAEQAAPA